MWGSTLITYNVLKQPCVLIMYSQILLDKTLALLFAVAFFCNIIIIISCMYFEARQGSHEKTVFFKETDDEFKQVEYPLQYVRFWFDLNNCKMLRLSSKELIVIAYIHIKHHQHRITCNQLIFVCR